MEIVLNTIINYYCNIKGKTENILNVEGYCFGRQSSDQIAGGLRLDQCHYAVFLDKKLQSLQP